MPEDNTAATPSIPPVDPAVATPEINSAPEANAAPVQSAAPVDSVVVDPTVTSEAPASVEDGRKDIYTEVAGKIRDSKNVLIALSSDPSVDEMAAAIGLSLYLDKLGKRATAIYSGTTPNALEFLKPDETFESTADTLQDFVIALSKDKADHLRYKLDGDYVKIYITPYKARISEEDLEFSYGDYNVDLVLALDVANGIDLDAALREHGRIMHDAVIINVTTGNPGKFGEIEWSDKHASSVSEMIAKLLYNVSGAEVSKEEATAFLTGIVAATNRFSNAGTTPETMQIASKLMKSGANQQLVSKNITPDIENEMMSLSDEGDETAKIAEINEADVADKKPSEKDDAASLDIEHKSSDEAEDVDRVESAEGNLTDENKEPQDKASEDLKANAEPQNDKSEQKDESAESGEDNSLLDDLKAAEESLSHAGAEAVPETKKEAVKIDSENGTSNMDEVKPEAAPANSEEQAIEAPAGEKVLKPSDDFDSAPMTVEDENKYGKMLEDALGSVNGTESAPEVSTATDAVNADAAAPVENPAATAAPAVPDNPEINGVPEMNYMPMPDEQILPPPPAPPIDMSGAMPASEPVVPATPAESVTQPVASATPTEPVTPIEPAAPVAESEPTSLGEQPAMQDQVYNSQAAQGADPGAFKIPGM